MARSPDPLSWLAGGRRGGPRRAAGFGLLSLLVLMVIAGAGMLTAAFTGASAPPQPAVGIAPDASTSAPGSGLPPAGGRRSARPGPPAVALGPSVPTRLVIPRIGVDTALLQLGVNADGTMQVPDVHQQPKTAGWYKLGASPGEIGNAVLVGHVDSKAVGPAVFYNIGSLKPGDTMTVTRSDRKVVTFRVDAVGSYPKTAFPTNLVYAPTGQPGLRLITCGGEFDRAKHSYKNNIVVLATAVSAR
ncbi:class F sortase [Plantactinospora siamensis]|uniref:Class F sortase n=1 Tax=Plantactinospora siamensis TaxID=555372 RepID=A0ABV6NY14_9ACTN